MRKKTLYSILPAILVFISAVCFGQAPSADFTSNVTGGCAPLIVSFQDKSTGSPTSWMWDLGNGITSTKPNPSASYFTPGVYPIKLTVTNASGSSTKTGTITVYESPSPEFVSEIQQGCTPSRIHFTDQSTAGSGNTNVSWVWDFGNGVQSSDQNAVGLYTTPGTFSIVLKVTNDKGCSKTITKTDYINITQGVQPNFSISAPSSCSTPFPVTFTNNSTGPGQLTYTWDFGDGSTSTTTPSPVHSYAATGVYPITLIVSSSLGCSDTLRKDSALVIPEVKADFTIPDTICATGTLHFTNTSTPTPVSAVWSFSDGTTIDSIDATKTFAAPGNYSVKLTNTYSNCSKDTTKNIVVAPNPVAAFTPSKDAQCKTDFTVTFNNQSQNGISYTWDFGDSSDVQTTTSNSAVTHTFTKFGTFNVTLTVYNLNGCSATTTHQIKVIQPSISFANLPVSGCVPITIKPEPIINSPTKIVSYSWDFGDNSGNVSTPQPGHTYTSQGIYNVSLTITTEDGCTVPYKLNSAVRIGTKPDVKFTASPLDECASDSVHFVNGSTPLDAAPTWYFGDGTTSNITNPAHSYTDTGWFQVKLVMDNNGCKDSFITDKQYIHIKPPIARFNFIPDCNIPYKYTFRDSSMFDPESAGRRTWHWVFPDGSTSDAQTPPAYQFPGPGNYPVTLTVSNGTCTNTIAQSLFIPDRIPRIGFDKASECKPAYVVLHAVLSNYPEIVNYTWQVEGHTFQLPAPDQGYVFYKSGEFPVNLTVTDKFGCSYSASDSIHISGPNPAFTGKNLQGCKGLKATFIDQSKTDGLNNLASWTWDFGDSTERVTTTSHDPVEHIYNQQGTFSVKLIVTDASGCSDSLTIPDMVIISVLKANWDATPKVCLGSPITFRNLSNGNYISSIWSFGDQGAPVQMNNPTGTYTYKDTGFYNIKLLVEDQYGCKDSLTRERFVQVGKPHASFSVNDSVSFCPPFDVAFTNNSLFAGRAEWDFSTGETSNQWDVRKLYTIPGRYTVTLKVTSPDGMCVDDTSKTIILKSAIDADLKYDPLTACRPAEVTLSAFDRFQSAQFFWDFGDGNTLDTSLNEVKHVYNDLGTFTPKIILSENSGCVIPLAGIEPIFIKGAYANFKIDNRFFCDSGYVFINDSTVYNEPIKYHWDFGDGTTSADSVPLHQYTRPGIFPVYLAVESESGCKDTARLSTPIKVVQSPLISIQGDSIICVNQYMVHSGLFDRSDTSQVYWAWAFPNGQTATGQTPGRQQYTQAGDFEVEAIAVNSSGCSDTALMHVKVNPLPQITLPTVITTQVGTPVQFPASYSPNVVSYTWQPGATLNCTECPKPIASPKFNTVYSVSFTDSNGCRNSASVQVVVTCPSANVFVPNTFSPNNDGNNDVFYVRGRGLERVKTLRIFNRWGQVVFERNNFPVNDASSGWDGRYNGNKPQADVYVYQLEVFCENGEIIHFEGNVALIQ